MKEEHKGYKLKELLSIAKLKRSTYYEIISKENIDKYREIKKKKYLKYIMQVIKSMDIEELDKN